MAGEVTVGIRGDIKDLQKKIDQATKEVRGFASKTKQAGKQAGSGFAGVSKAAGLVGTAIRGAFAVAPVKLALKVIQGSIESVLKRARLEAAKTQKAFQKAFSASIGTNFGTKSFTITTREEAVKAARFVKSEFNRVQADLERNFSKLVRLPGFEGGLEVALDLADALGGIGTEERARLKILLEQREQLRVMSTEFEGIVKELDFSNKLAKQFEQNLGLVADKAKKAKKNLEAPRPNFSGPIDPTQGQSFQTFGNFGPLPPVDPGVQDFLDPSITLRLLDIEKLAKANAIPALQALQEKASLLQEQLIFMVLNGVKPTSEEFLAMQARLTEVQGAMGALNGEVQTLGQQIIVDLGQEAAAGVADLLLGFENLENVLEGIKGALRNIVAQIAAAAAKAAILSFLFPGAGGFGQLFKAGLGLVPFASGGIVTGPTPALVGEAGPEAIIPLDRLKSLGLQDNLVLETRVSGTDLLTMLRRTNTSRVGRGGPISI